MPNSIPSAASAAVASAGRLFLAMAATTILLPVLLFSPCTRAYIPAQPTNDTSWLDKTDASTLTIKLSFPPREYSGPVSYQLRSDDWTSDTTRGALVHFTEYSARFNETVATPWIAYISCDQNETNASDLWDIFTLARDHGAVSALLYSLTSEACVLNNEYIEDFEKPLDVFATTSRAVSEAFQEQWESTNETYAVYNGTLLNESWADINVTLEGGTLTRRTYLAGILTSRNGTAQAVSTRAPSPSDHSGGGKNNKAMIAVYVITGFLAAMVCITVISVIRRSLQPVDQGYGTGRNGAATPVVRRGLAQAIVDTFPLQKFSKPQGKQLHSQSELDLELPEMPVKRVDSTIASSSMSPMSESRRTSAEVGADDDDHCPICLLEFETGDDLRVLPCTGKHRFHQACVDPWLLRVSTSCPLCRKDFNPEVEVDSSSDDEGPSNPTPAARTRTPRVTQRYMALISRARRRNRTNSAVSENTARPLRPREADQNGPGGY